MGLSFIEFNMFPINIFKISYNEHVFTVLALIFVKENTLLHQLSTADSTLVCSQVVKIPILPPCKLMVWFVFINILIIII